MWCCSGSQNLRMKFGHFQVYKTWCLGNSAWYVMTLILVCNCYLYSKFLGQEYWTSKMKLPIYISTNHTKHHRFLRLCYWNPFIKSRGQEDVVFLNTSHHWGLAYRAWKKIIHGSTLKVPEGPIFQSSDVWDFSMILILLPKFDSDPVKLKMVLKRCWKQKASLRLKWNWLHLMPCKLHMDLHQRENMVLWNMSWWHFSFLWCNILYMPVLHIYHVFVILSWNFPKTDLDDLDHPTVFSLSTKRWTLCWMASTSPAPCREPSSRCNWSWVEWVVSWGWSWRVFPRWVFP